MACSETNALAYFAPQSASFVASLRFNSLKKKKEKSAAGEFFL
jgi:hypothetical protein